MKNKYETKSGKFCYDSFVSLKIGTGDRQRTRNIKNDQKIVKVLL